MFYEIVVKLYFTNNAINFFLYVISGQKFRNDLINLFKWNKGKSKKISLNNVSATNTSVTVVHGMN